MGQYAYRLTVDETHRLRRDFSWIAFYLEQLLQFIFSILFLYGIVYFLYQILTSPFRLIFTKRRVPAFVKEIIVDRKPGSAWFWWTYVTFVVGRKEKTFRLTPGQATKFVIRLQIREADPGKLSYFGRRLIAWHPIKRSERIIPKVFISYSQNRSPEAELVVSILKSQGLQVWLDKEKLLAGDSLPEKIQQAILSSQAFVPLLCPEYIASEWCQRELQFACAKIPQLVKPIQITSDKLFIPSFIKKSLAKAGEPLFLDLNKKDSLEELRAISNRIYTRHLR